MYKKILLICFLFSLMLLIPKNKFNEETSYVSSEKKLSYIYLLDNNNYLAKTDIQVKDEIKDLIDALIIDGPMEESIPSGFQSRINENKKLINYETNHNYEILNPRHCEYTKNLLTNVYELIKNIDITRKDIYNPIFL